LPGARPNKKPVGTKPEEPAALTVEKTPELHKLTILSGDFEQTFVYSKNDKGEWLRLGQFSDEKAARSKPAQAPTPPAAKPADGDKGDKSFKSDAVNQGPAIPAKPPVGDRVP
jgi:hypothetical protein